MNMNTTSKFYGVVFEQNGDRDCSLLRHMNEQESESD
jgi:hypothetical protein